MIIMELCPNNYVLDVDCKTTPGVPMEKKVNYVYGAALGLQYLHSKNIVYFDLAARNTLFGKGDVAKISDFGLSITGGERATSRDRFFTWPSVAMFEKPIDDG